MGGQYPQLSSFLRRDVILEVPGPALSWVPTGHLGTTEETSAI